MKKVGLALGGGGARGCAHLGVIKALNEAGIEIHAVAGTSIGSIVGGIFAAGELGTLEDYLLSIKVKDVIRQFDPVLMKNGMFEGEKVLGLLDSMLKKKSFRSTNIPFVAVATDLVTGQEVRLDKGKLSHAIRASISLPGIFTAVKKGKNHLIDGGLVNPLPVNVVHDLGADFVIAIDLNHKYIEEKRKAKMQPDQNKWQIAKIMKSEYPNMVDVIEGSVFLMQDQITQKNLEQYPADLLLNLKLSSASLFDFHKAKVLIEEGYKQMRAKIPALKRLLEV